MLFLLPLEYFGKLFFGGRFVLYEISLRLKSGEHFVLRIIVLTGFDINTSEKRVAVAALSDKTAKVDYTYFEIPFEFLKDYEEGAKYKLAIVCSSSKEGDLFKGAGGSTLILDELEVMGE